MKSTLIGTTLGALSLAFATGAFAAAAPASSASTNGASKAQPMQSAPTTSMGSTQKQAATTSSNTGTTTTRGPSSTGQPNKSCEDLGNQPGRSMSAPGSAFNPDGKAGSVYAGEQPQNSRNTASVSQYDVACARPSK